MKVSVVVANWNGLKLLKKNFPQLIASANFAKNAIYEVIVVDNGSQDDSLKYLTGLNFLKLKVIKNNKNMGFPVAVNQGVKLAKGDIICSLNNDVAPTKNFLEEALGLFGDESVFAISLHEKGEGPSVGKFEAGHIGFTRGVEKGKVQSSFWASGGSGLFRKKYWDKLGGFDEMFSPGYWEDLDLCYRARKRGYSILWSPDSLVFHKHESSYTLLAKSYISLVKERNQLLMMWKDITSRKLLWLHLIGLVSRLVRHPGYIKVVVALISKLPGVVSDRRLEKHESVVTDEEILGLKS